MRQGLKIKSLLAMATLAVGAMAFGQQPQAPGIQPAPQQPQPQYQQQQTYAQQGQYSQQQQGLPPIGLLVGNNGEQSPELRGVWKSACRPQGAYGATSAAELNYANSQDVAFIFSDYNGSGFGGLQIVIENFYNDKTCKGSQPHPNHTETGSYTFDSSDPTLPGTGMFDFTLKTCDGVFCQGWSMQRNFYSGGPVTLQYIPLAHTLTFVGIAPNGSQFIDWHHPNLYPPDYQPVDFTPPFFAGGPMPVPGPIPVPPPGPYFR